MGTGELRERSQARSGSLPNRSCPQRRTGARTRRLTFCRSAAKRSPSQDCAQAVRTTVALVGCSEGSGADDRAPPQEGADDRGGIRPGARGHVRGVAAGGGSQSSGLGSAPKAHVRQAQSRAAAMADATATIEVLKCAKHGDDVALALMVCVHAVKSIEGRFLHSGHDRLTVCMTVCSALTVSIQNGLFAVLA